MIDIEDLDMRPRSSAYDQPDGRLVDSILTCQPGHRPARGICADSPYATDVIIGKTRLVILLSTRYSSSCKRIIRVVTLVPNSKMRRVAARRKITRMQRPLFGFKRTADLPCQCDTMCLCVTTVDLYDTVPVFVAHRHPRPAGMRATALVNPGPKALFGRDAKPMIGTRIGAVEPLIFGDTMCYRFEQNPACPTGDHRSPPSALHITEPRSAAGCSGWLAEEGSSASFAGTLYGHHILQKCGVTPPGRSNGRGGTSRLIIPCGGYFD